jgi:hypothetical protein
MERFTDMENDFRLLAQYFLSVMEGDDYLIDDAYALLRKHGIVDEDGFAIFEEEEDE